MISLNELDVLNAEVNVDYGFFFVELSNGKTLQCCLEQDGDQYQSAISLANNGYNDGSCYNCNEWAFVDDEGGHINEFLIEQAREAGLEIVA